MPPAAVFVFPSAAGHVNPSLPLCTRLVKGLGWRVEYLSMGTFKAAVESTGATYHDRDEVFAEFGIPDVTKMMLASLEKYDDPGAKQWGLNFGSIGTAALLPAYLEFLWRVCRTPDQPGRLPDLLVYCPVLCQAAYFAAQKLGIPAVSLLTAAGPGYYDAAFDQLGGGRAGYAGLAAVIRKNQANAEAIQSIRELLGRPELELNTVESKPVCHEYYSRVNIVTTVSSLADRLWEENEQYYAGAGKSFEFVGPLLHTGEDDAAPRPAATVADALSAEQTADLFGRVEEALAQDRRVVYVSLGTVLTSTASPEHGWLGTSGSALTGRELCQAVCRAVFDELGGATALLSPAPLIVASVGPEEDALDKESVPSIPDSALCLKSVPQAELLRRAGPGLALVVTHGGQNTFMEALSVGSPLVVCPGFGDQVANAKRAQALGPRMAEAESGAADAASCRGAYQQAVAAAVREVLGSPAFAAKARAVAKELEQGGSVDRAAQILCEAAGVEPA